VSAPTGRARLIGRHRTGRHAQVSSVVAADAVGARF
jgi:hypothetical protein